jgi:hypothetical protein
VLAVNVYDSKYVDQCAAKMDAQLEAYQRLARGGGAAIEAFAPLFFGNLVLVLDQYFVHRTRSLEGKDGNPLNEVRMLANAILRHDGVLAPDNSIKYQPDTSVLKLRIGDAIRVDEGQFRALAKAYFAEMRRKFTAKSAKR